MNKKQQALLKTTAKQMVAKGKGILAADESSTTCQKRFESVNVECTESNRRAYRQTLLTSPGLEQYISGVILHDETFHQSSDDGVSFPQVLASKGILPGIKVDAGTKDLALHPGEMVTEGLDNLRARFAHYAELGAKFAKWRAVITIGKSIPSQACIQANAHSMARYAALAQEAGIVPMVEPEVLINGNHSIADCYNATVAIQTALFRELKIAEVYLPGVIMKTSMVITGNQNKKQSTSKEVAQWTLKCLKKTTPQDLGGVVFLSGGQGDEQATENLDAMNKMGTMPWKLSFSYARSIQHPVLKVWSEDIKNNISKAQEVLIFRAKMNSLATMGKYDSKLEEMRPY